MTKGNVLIIVAVLAFHFQFFGFLNANAQSGPWEQGQEQAQSVAGLPETDVEDILGGILDALITYLIPIFVAIVIISGIILITSGGVNSSYVEWVKNILTFAIAGLVIALLAFVILRILSNILYGGSVGTGSSDLDPYFDF